MAFYAWNFACSPAVGYNDPLSVENLAMARLLLGNMSIRDSGILYWTDSSYVAQVGSLSNPFDGLFEPADAGGGVVSVQSGAAIVNGYLFISDAETNFDINGDPGNANATDRIVLRWTAATQDVALTRVNGAAGNTAVLTQTSTVWDTPIARAELDGLGELVSVIDDRRLAMPTGTIVKLGDYTGDGTDTTVSFSVNTNLFTNLKIVGKCRTDAATSDVAIRMRFNADSAANYEFVNNVIDSSPATTPGANLAADHIQIGNAPGTTSTANHGGDFEVLIPSYADGLFKSCFMSNRYINSGAARFLYTGTGTWRDVSIITDIEFSFGGPGGNFIDGSKITLYGVT